MGRPLRIEYPGAYYHVMNRGLAYSDIFLDDNDRQRFLLLIGETCKLWNVSMSDSGRMHVDGNWSRSWLREVLFSKHGLSENEGTD